MTIAAGNSPMTDCAASQALGLIPSIERTTAATQGNHARWRSRPWRNRRYRTGLEHHSKREPLLRRSRVPPEARTSGPGFPGGQVQDQ